MSSLIRSGAKLQSASTPMTMLFDNKKDNIPMDAQIWAGQKGIALVYRLNNIASTSPETLDWLKRYNAFISGTLKAPATPAAERCTVMVEATYTGQLMYYFTYMMRYADESLAQDMPQSRLYATEPLQLTVPALTAEQAAPAPQASEQREASWL